MTVTSRNLAAVGLLAALAALAPIAKADSIQTKAVDLGTLPLNYTTNYGSSFSSAQLTPADTFYDDYRFSVAGGSFSSVSATFDLGTVFSISNLSARLLIDPNPGAPLTPSPWSIPSNDILQKWSNTVASGEGSGSVQVINPYVLGAGSYILEVRGNVTGTAGGSYAGVFNVAAVPEASGVAMTLAGFGLLAMFARRPR